MSPFSKFVFDLLVNIKLLLKFLDGLLKFFIFEDNFLGLLALVFKLCS